jgi:hypothetical protein
MIAQLRKGARRLRMSKKNEGSGGSTTLITTMATTGGLLPKVTLPEALAWGVATGVIVETARFFIVRSTMKRPASDESASS